jgi:hypothetical protein
MMSELTKTLKKYAERTILETWEWYIKHKYRDRRFAGVMGIGFEDGKYYVKMKDLAKMMPFTNPRMARDIAKSHLSVTQGPIPHKIPHVVVLVPLPSFLLAIRPRDQFEIFRDWKGVTLAFEDIPYCEYKVLR